jgi:RNA polymerase primary sigma factor
MNAPGPDAALTHYLREISQIPVLKPEQEIDLGRRIRQGDAAARERMIQANLRLVVTIARSYSDFGVPLADLIAEGNVGLITAVDRFNPEKGAKLSSYASWYIKQAIKRALTNQSKIVRIPAQTVAKLSQMRRISAGLSNDLGREATTGDIADELGISTKKLEWLLTVGVAPAYLDDPGDDGDSAIAENIPDERSPVPFEPVQMKELSERLERGLQTLSEREAKFLAHRYGLKGTAAKPLQHAANLVGITRERARQVEWTALAKLRRMFDTQLGSLETEFCAAT